ncbi:MAG: hypothetical protein ACUZ77_08100 [Candidatus Brocadiales bacterium]
MTRDGISTGRKVAETVYATNKGKQAFRMIVLRWQDKQMELFKDTYHYHCTTSCRMPWRHAVEGTHRGTT